MDSKKKENMKSLKIQKKQVKHMSKINSNIKSFPDKILNRMISFIINSWVKDLLVKYF